MGVGEQRVLGDGWEFVDRISESVDRDEECDAVSGTVS